MADEVQTVVVRGAPAVLTALREASGLLSGHPIPARPLWLSCWIEAFRDHVPVALMLRRGDAVIGFACLAMRRRGPCTEFVLAGDGPSDHARLTVADPAVAEQLASGIAAVVRRTRGPWRLRFDKVPANDPVVHALTRLLPCSAIEPAAPRPTLEIGEPRTLQAHTHKSLREQARKARRKIEQAGLRLDADVVTAPAAIRALGPELQEVAQRRDHEMGRRSPFDRKYDREFYDLVMAELAAAGELTAVTIRLDGDLATYGLELVEGDVRRSWDLRMNSDYAWVGIGSLLYSHFLERALADPAVDRVDWGSGMSQNKRKVSSGVEEDELLIAYSGHLTRAWCHADESVCEIARDKLPPSAKRALRGDFAPWAQAIEQRIRSLRPAGCGRSASGGPAATPASSRRSGVRRDSLARS